VTAYVVERWTSAIGVCMAVGANRGLVVVMVQGEAFRRVGIGHAFEIPGLSAEAI
jgi:hypothetical protein